ncbi:hypothetical protein CYMTET_26369 [Cymbomonas tetramitiformis]|uniref:CTLH domain-containing protein n=1 Tax=Cymbomonas tetramitiformis TaxID=36881 RepID=A0AAE0KY84_9CHLO|nr:hypothetical protein CYMTET_26369 [Cymbomonas tetramitiformis]
MEAEQLPVLPSRWKNDFIALMLGFLEENGYAKSMKALEEESGLRQHRFGKEMTFLRELILAGDFPAAETFIEPLKARSSEDYTTVLYALRKQYVLESFGAEGDSVSVDDIVGKLQKLDELCSEEEMNDLCYCMTLPTVQEHPSYTTWTVHRGRLECFHLVYSKLCCLYPSAGSEHTSDAPLLAGSEARTETILRQAAAWEQQHAPEGAASEGKRLRWQEPYDFNILGSTTPSRHDAGKGEAAADWECAGVTASLPASVPRLRTSTLPSGPSGTPTSPQPHLTSWWARRSVAAGNLSGGFSYTALRDAKARRRSKTQPLPFAGLETDHDDTAPAQDRQDVAPQVQGSRDDSGAMHALGEPVGGVSVELPSPSREAPIASLDQHCFDLTPTSTPAPSGASLQGGASTRSAERTLIEASSHMGGPEWKPEALPLRLPNATTGDALQSPELQSDGISVALPDALEPAADSLARQKPAADPSATSFTSPTRAPTSARRRSSLQEAATYESLNPRNDFVAIDVTSDKQARNLNPDQRQAGAQPQPGPATSGAFSPDGDKQARSLDGPATSRRATSARTGDKQARNLSRTSDNRRAASARTGDSGAQPRPGPATSRRATSSGPATSDAQPRPGPATSRRATSARTSDKQARDLSPDRRQAGAQPQPGPATSRRATLAPTIQDVQAAQSSGTS